MRKLVFLNEKGGTGKTTISTHFAAFKATGGKARVLLLDMDPQGQVSKSLGMDLDKSAPDMFDLLVDDRLALDAVIVKGRIAGLDVVPANKRLTDFSVNVSEDSDRYLKLWKKLKKLDGYEYIVVDPPPSLGLLTLNILMAVNEVYIPVGLTYLGLDGCAEIVRTVKLVRDNFGKNDLCISGVIPTFYRRTRLAREISGKLDDEFGGRMFRTKLRFNVKIDEAQSHGKTIFEYAPRSTGAGMMAEICKEVEGNG